MGTVSLKKKKKRYRMDMPETADYQKLLFLLLGTELDHTFLLSLGVAM